ncbi:MAG: hypothetical protein PUB33_06375 [Ligilactobacillus ruminis]|nr:hypothetical protein [Ligilactobacillus ruminis]
MIHLYECQHLLLNWLKNHDDDKSRSFCRRDTIGGHTEQ